MIKLRLFDPGALVGRQVFAVALFLLFGLYSPASATTIHVDGQSGFDTNPGTEAKPFKTIEKAAAVANPGDTVLIHEGIYHEQILGGNSGREGAPITFEGVNRDKVVLQGSVRIKDWQKEGNVWVKRGLEPITDINAFVMVDERRMLVRSSSSVALPEGNFHLSPDRTYTIRLWNDANPNLDHDVEVYELDLGFNSGNRWDGTAKKWITLRNMTLEKYGVFAISTDARYPAENSNWELDRITVRYNNAEGVFYCLDDWYVHDCTFTRNRGHGCQINGARVRFTNNYSLENEWFGPYVDGGCGVLLGPNESAQHCVMRNNVFEKNGHPEGYGCGVFLESRTHHNLIEGNLLIGNTPDGVGIYGSSHNVIVNNVIIDTAPKTKRKVSAAFLLDRGPIGLPNVAVRNLIAHNTVWGCRAPITVINPHDLSVYELNRFVNNLFAYCQNLEPMPAKPTVFLEGNWWFQCPAGRNGSLAKLSEYLQSMLGSGDDRVADNLRDFITGEDPRLINPQGGDFHTRPDSPLIGKGVTLRDVTHDKDGKPRPPDARPTIGAYQ